MLDIYPYTDAIYELCRKKATPKEKRAGRISSFQTLYEDFGKRLGRFKPTLDDGKRAGGVYQGKGSLNDHYRVSV